jgi:hypothetical protein
MNTRRILLWTLLIISLGLASVQVASAADDPLPSWSDGAAKRAIEEFVKRVTTPGGADFVPAPERIATFDNDGTLWAEQPIYFQFAFVFDRIKAMAPQHPEWKTKQPYQAVLDGDMEALGSTAMRPVKATEQLITHPVETAKGLPTGVKRLFCRVEPQPVAP